MLTSINNSKIKELIKLRKAGKRKESGLTVIEGRHEISMALLAQIKIDKLYLCSDFISDENFNIKVDQKKIIDTTKEVFEKISYREKPDGYLAVVKIETLELEDIKLSKNPLVLILEGIEKPGNLGAICRTAEAVGADAIILNNSQTDIYNPNVIRNSLGTVFLTPVATASFEDTVSWLKKNQIMSLATTPRAKENYYDIDMKSAKAIIIGAEHEGLSQDWLKGADKQIKIPMQGKIDSLNASVSASIILYEALRQRQIILKFSPFGGDVR